MKGTPSEHAPHSVDHSGLDRFGTDRRFAQSLARGLSVLRAFQPGDGPLGNQELASRTGLSKATVSRLTFTLTQLGYLERLHAVEKYRLGSGVMALGRAPHVTLPFIDVASKPMQELADELGALVALAVPDGPWMLLMHAWRPSQSPSVGLRLGTQMPMTRSAVGLVYLAEIDTRERRHLVDKVLSSTAEERVEIYAEIEAARKSVERDGFVPSFGRWTSRLYAAAVPFRNTQLGAPYAFFTGASSSVIDRDALMNVFGPRLAQCVARLHAG
ncbi:MAG TPA: IclR family transcriptional regulator [Burkholderiaceae bacterium]|nr:IclR family transcriptional regulator [Burkholderiaceae bacterium]